MQNPDEAESIQALVTAMHLLCTEAKYPKNPDSKSTISTSKLRNIIQQMLSTKKLNNHLFARFKEYGAYLDIVYSLWKILPDITVKEKTPGDIYVQNYLDLINAIPISAEVQEKKQLLCCNEDTFEFDYPIVRKNLNKVWASILQWTDDLTDTTHKQLLVVLIEKILCHLDKPILLTDFLMDSLDVGMLTQTNQSNSVSMHKANDEFFCLFILRWSSEFVGSSRCLYIDSTAQFNLSKALRKIVFNV